MEINSNELIAKLSAEKAYLECLLYLLSAVSDDERLEESPEVQTLLASFEIFVKNRR